MIGRLWARFDRLMWGGRRVRGSWAFQAVCQQVCMPACLLAWQAPFGKVCQPACPPWPTWQLPPTWQVLACMQTTCLLTACYACRIPACQPACFAGWDV